MTDASPDPGDHPLIPDAVSTAALHAALGHGMPPATDLPDVHFGHCDRHEGIHDLALFLTLLCAREDRACPSRLQLIHGLCYMVDVLQHQMRESFAITDDFLVAEMERNRDLNPMRYELARRTREEATTDRDELLDHLTRAEESLKAVCNRGVADQMAIELLNATGDAPRPDRRKRYISDEFLSSIGINIPAFETYFHSRSGS